MAKKVSIKDIAAACGVSTATVSRVVHNHPHIQDSLRSTVKETMRRMGYVPIRKTVKNTVALIIPSGIYSYYISSLVNALSSELHRHGYVPETINQRDIDIVEKDFIVGAIMLPYRPGLEKDWGNKYDIPLVVINSRADNIDGVYSVMSDDYQCLRLAVDYLYDCGHRRIALLNHFSTDNINDINRFDAYKREMARHYLPFREELLVPLVESTLPELLGQMLWANPTALICCGESSGLRVSYLLHLLNRKIPDDISLVTFEQPGISAYAIPPHTTLSQDFSTIAAEAVNMIINRPANKSVSVPYKLLKRYSVGKL